MRTAMLLPGRGRLQGGAEQQQQGGEQGAAQQHVGRPRARWAYSTLQRMSNKYDAIQKQYFKDNLSAVCSSLGSRVQARTI